MTDSLKFIRVIGDYGHLSDMAFAEVSDRIHAQLVGAGIQNYKMDLSSVPAFDTYATGFMLAQLAVNSPLKDKHYFYVNTAPRKDNKSARIHNEGEGLVYAKLRNGVQIVAVNSGYSLTLIKPFTDKIVLLNVDNKGSQFRSRDIFPVALGAVMRGDQTIFGKDVTNTVLDEFPEDRVVYTDGYGNMKCSIDPSRIDDLIKTHTKGEIRPRVEVNIEGGKNRQNIQLGAGIFDVHDGEFCVARGSSGWDLPGGLRKAFTEIIKRGGSAAAAFDHPVGGAEVKMRLAPEHP